jgi:hypothetical protein
MPDVPRGGKADAGLSPLEFWLGLFLILYSAGYVSIALRLSAFGGGAGRVSALAWVAIGLAFFAAGGFLVMQGLSYPITRVSFLTAALLIAFRAAWGSVSAGNPFTATVSTATNVALGLGLVADLALVAGALWFLLTTTRAGVRDDAVFGRGATVFLAAFALQTAIVPAIESLLYLFTNSQGFSAFAGLRGMVYAVKILPTLVRGVAGLAVLVAVRRFLGNRPPSAAVIWAAGLWATADLLLVAALWIAWQAEAAFTTLALLGRIRTTLFVALPALALLVITAILRREARA